MVCDGRGTHHQAPSSNASAWCRAIAAGLVCCCFLLCLKDELGHQRREHHDVLALLLRDARAAGVRHDESPAAPHIETGSGARPRCASSRLLLIASAPTRAPPLRTAERTRARQHAPSRCRHQSPCECARSRQALGCRRCPPPEGPHGTPPPPYRWNRDALCPASVRVHWHPGAALLHARAPSWARAERGGGWGAALWCAGTSRLAGRRPPRQAQRRVAAACTQSTGNAPVVTPGSSRRGGPDHSEALQTGRERKLPEVRSALEGRGVHLLFSARSPEQMLVRKAPRWALVECVEGWGSCAFQGTSRGSARSGAATGRSGAAAVRQEFTQVIATSARRYGTTGMAQHVPCPRDQMPSHAQSSTIVDSADRVSCGRDVRRRWAGLLTTPHVCTRHACGGRGRFPRSEAHAPHAHPQRHRRSLGAKTQHSIATWWYTPPQGRPQKSKLQLQRRPRQAVPSLPQAFPKACPQSVESLSPKISEPQNVAKKCTPSAASAAPHSRAGSGGAGRSTNGGSNAATSTCALMPVRTRTQHPTTSAACSTLSPRCCFEPPELVVANDGPRLLLWRSLSACRSPHALLPSCGLSGPKPALHPHQRLVWSRRQRRCL